MIKYKIFDYEGKETYVNSNTGLRTIEVSKDLLFKIQDFYGEVLGKEINFKEDIRGFKDLNRDNKFSFKCGAGYDVLDSDLLNGYNDGLKRRIFEEYLDYKENKKESSLNNIESYINDFNRNHNEKISHNFIENEKKIIEFDRENECDGWEKEKEADYER